MNIVSFSIFGPNIRSHHDQEEESSTLGYISNIVRRLFNVSESSENIRTSNNNYQITTNDLINNTSLSINQSDCEAQSQEQCSICRDSIQSYQIIRTIKKCGHRFHQGCIDNWFIQHHTCPICRDSVSISQSRDAEQSQQQSQQSQQSQQQQQQQAQGLFRFPVQFEFDL